MTPGKSRRVEGRKPSRSKGIKGHKEAQIVAQIHRLQLRPKIQNRPGRRRGSEVSPVRNNRGGTGGVSRLRGARTAKKTQPSSVRREADEARGENAKTGEALALHHLGSEKDGDGRVSNEESVVQRKDTKSQKKGKDSKGLRQPRWYRTGKDLMGEKDDTTGTMAKGAKASKDDKKGRPARERQELTEGKKPEEKCYQPTSSSLRQKGTGKRQDGIREGGQGIA